MLITFPTVLTIGRLLLVPFIAYSMLQRAWLIALLLFSIAAITDILDGYFARKWHQETQLGACLDPVVDKVLVISCYAVLVFAPVQGLAIPAWFLSIVLAKEVVLLGGALYWGVLKQEIEVKASWLGKLAMAVQSMLIGWVILCSIFHWMPIRTFHLVLAAALILVIASLIHYAYSLMVEV